MGAGWDIGIGELPPGLIGMKADGGKKHVVSLMVMGLSMNGSSVANVNDFHVLSWLK